MYELVLKLIAKAKTYEELHAGLRYIYDQLDIDDPGVFRFKVLLIDYCSDIVVNARQGLEIASDDKIPKSRKALVDFCENGGS